MSASEKIKAVLQLKGLKQKDLAAYLGMSEQSMRNKFARGSFSVDDLIKVATLSSAPLGFEISPNSRIIFDNKDIKPMKITVYAPKNKMAQNPISPKRAKVAFHKSDTGLPDIIIVEVVEINDAQLTFKLNFTDKGFPFSLDEVDLSSKLSLQALEATESYGIYTLPLEYIWAIE